MSFNKCVYYIHTAEGYLGCVASRQQAQQMDAHSVIICDEKETSNFIEWGNKESNIYVLNKALEVGFSRIDESAFFERLDEGKKYVYFIVAKGLNRVKIGYSCDPTRRLRELNTASPVELIIHRRMVGNEQIEKELHSRFSKYRIKNEWFQFHNEIKSYANINSI